MKTIYGSNRVLDLIYNQDSDKQRLLVENKDFDCVVTCMIGREGTDWPACSRVHNLVLDRNVLQPIQKMGRATRRYQLKHNIVMTCYIEHFTDWENDGDELKNKFTDYFNAILAMSIYDDLFYPIKLPVIRPPVDNVSKDSDDENENNASFGGKRKSKSNKRKMRKTRKVSKVRRNRRNRRNRRQQGGNTNGFTTEEEINPLAYLDQREISEANMPRP